ncbi:MAG TPA: DUF3592 domain-containing protein [Acetivibrio sp.]|uniref:DUF3592 domain-containing protein n=1 Tax=Acetivibrio sp. TaxID=1872092 RepID=UPI002C6C43A4|nr:DUF3592 domain-containing protein [Acetivibrio sp.]HOM02353.1 DUF3592 domain-containing protein [Acetivibrio sp.]
MKKNAIWILGIIFAAVGLIPTIIGVILGINHFNFLKSAVKTTAVITKIDSYRDFDGDRHYNVQIKYFVEGEEYYDTLGYYSSGMREGKEITVYYDPDNPENVQSTGSMISDIVLVVIGLIFTAIGVSFIISQVNKSRLRERLMATGQLVYADINEVILNKNYTVNGKHPYIITCSWKDPYTGLFYFFNSDNIWFDPEPIIKENGITTLPVYIDPENPKKYFVSTEDVEMFVANV